MPQKGKAYEKPTINHIHKAESARQARLATWQVSRPTEAKDELDGAASAHAHRAGRQWHTESCPRQKWLNAGGESGGARLPEIGETVTCSASAGPRRGWVYRDRFRSRYHRCTRVHKDGWERAQELEVGEGD